LNNETEPAEETFLILEEEVYIHCIRMKANVDFWYHRRCPWSSSLCTTQLHCISKNHGI